MPCFPFTSKQQKKSRLNIALYRRPGQPDAYEWTFIITPKPTDPPTSTRGDPSNPTPLARFGVYDYPYRREDGTMSEERRVERGEVLDIECEGGLHVLVTVGKICSSTAVLEDVLRTKVPVYQAAEVGEGEGGRLDSVQWIGDALEVLRKGGVVTGTSAVTGKEPAWGPLREEVEGFAERMLGPERDEVGWYGEEGTPCWDVLDGRVFAIT
ncbi:hypothetical protein BJ875DRAFT_543519 [Amylocarpus encephaloides]|uniref:Uncharacterized protein n=1 Tax=Amylocarpus encephaloides TaxID=45428 RepID=A0A9P8C4L4_9HELO|nr:hypothetical protein BJ875DRAFT_543519 [Amylocarpus encephaloides]